MSNTHRRWFSVIPMAFQEIPEFWQRDAGLVCLGFRALGIDARFVALGTPALREDLPLVLASKEQMHDAAWWRQWGLEGVVIWGGHQVAEMAQAIRAAGAKVVIHLDTDGVSSSRVGFWSFARRNYDVYRDQGRWPAALRAAFKTLLFHCLPALDDRRQTQESEMADLLTINSPLARQRFCRLMKSCGRPDLAARVKLNPSPLSLDAALDPSVPKQRQIVAAGRLAAYQKDAPRLMKVLERVLVAEPGYVAVLAGSGAAMLERLRSRMPVSVQSRCHVRGYLEREALMRLYRESRILLVGSHYESLNLAAVEALASGCSVVGPAAMAPINYLASASSGTLAASRSVPDLADALEAEIQAWEERERDPVAISRRWRERFSAEGYARRVLAHFGVVEPPSTSATS